MPKTEKEIERDKIKFERFKEKLEELRFIVTGDCFDNLEVRDYLGNAVIKDRKNIKGSGYRIIDTSDSISHSGLFIEYNNGIQIGVEAEYDSDDIQIPRGEYFELKYKYPNDATTDKKKDKEEKCIVFILKTEASRPSDDLSRGITEVSVLGPDTELAAVTIYHNENGINFFEYCPVEDPNGIKLDNPDEVTEEIRLLFDSIIEVEQNRIPNSDELKTYIEIMLTMNNKTMKGLEDYFDHNIDRYIDTINRKVERINWKINEQERERAVYEEKISYLRDRKNKKGLSKKKPDSQQ